MGRNRNALIYEIASPIISVRPPGGTNGERALRFQADEHELGRYRADVEAIRAVAEASPIIADSVLDALAEGSIEIAGLTEIAEQSQSDSARAAAIEKRASIAGLQALDVRNFASAGLKKLREELGPVASDTWREIKIAVPRGVGRGVESALTASIKVGVASLVAAIAHPLAGLGMIIVSFAPLAKRAEDAERMLSEPEDANEPSET